MKKLLGTGVLFCIILTALAGCGGGSGGNGGGGGVTETYYAGTITLTRTGTGQTYTYNEREIIQVNQLSLDTDMGGGKGEWVAYSAQLDASAEFSNTAPVGEFNFTISSNGLHNALPGDYWNTHWVVMFLDPQQKTLKLNISSFDYECTYDPPVEHSPWPILGVLFTVELPANPPVLRGSTMISPDPNTGANLEISWDLTRRN